MPKLLDALVANAAYAFIAVGVVWLAVAVLASSALVLWPVIACMAGGVLLKLWPSERLTWAWAISSATMGFLLAVYQVYAWAGFLGGAFSSLAAASLVAFLAFAIAHVFLFYAGMARPNVPKSASS